MWDLLSQAGHNLAMVEEMQERRAMRIRKTVGLSFYCHCLLPIAGHSICDWAIAVGCLLSPLYFFFLFLLSSYIAN